MIRRPPRSTLSSSSAASDVYKRQIEYSTDFRRDTSHTCRNVSRKTILHACGFFAGIFSYCTGYRYFYRLACLLNAALQRALGHALERYIGACMRDGSCWRVCLQYVAKQKPAAAVYAARSRSVRRTRMLAAKMTSRGGFTLRHVTPSCAARSVQFVLLP